MQNNFKVLYDEHARDYHTSGAFGSHSLSSFLKNPRQFYKDHVNNRKAYVDPTTVKLTDALALGSAAHMLLLEGTDVFWNHYFLKPTYIDRRTKKGKDDYAEFMKENDGKIEVEHGAWDLLQNMHVAIDELPIITRMIEQGNPEVTIRGNLYGVPVQCRCDLLIDSVQTQDVAELLGVDVGDRVVVDLKTTRDNEGFPWALKRLKYYRQAAFYTHLMESAGIPAAKFVFLAVEKRNPSDVELFECSQQTMELGTLEVMKGLGDLADFLKCPLPFIQKDLSIKVLDVEPPQQTETKFEF